MIKRTTKKLVLAYPNRFSTNFEKNKEALADLAEIHSKKLRNVIAGYSVRLKQQEDAPLKARKREFTKQKPL